VSLRVEVVVGRLLFWGGTGGVVLALVGLLLYAAGGGLSAPIAITRPLLSRPEAGHPSRVFVSLGDIVVGLTGNTFDPLAVTALGLVLLLLTPVLGIAASIPLFVGRRDYRYAVIASTVLVMLLGCLFFGGRV
jgi:uncharacterized membrane protein